MNDPGQNDLERIKLELNARLEEYKALRAEIVATLTSSYQVMNLTIAATAVQVSALPAILQWPKPYLLAATPFVFYALVWIQLRYAYAVFNMSNHIIDVIAPSVRTALKDTFVAKDQAFDTILSWESAGRKPNHPRAIWLYPIELARYAVPLATALVVIVAYMVITVKQKSFDCATDGLLFLVNVLLLTYTVIALLWVRTLLQGDKAGSAHFTLVP